MSNLICFIVLVPIAYAAYKRARQCKEEGKDNEAIVWMVISVLTGAFAVILGLDAVLSVLSP